MSVTDIIQQKLEDIESKYEEFAVAYSELEELVDLEPDQHPDLRSAIMNGEVQDTRALAKALLKHAR